MKSRFASKISPKPKSQGSGAFLDDFDKIDISNKKIEMGDQYDELLQDSSNYRKVIPAHDFDDDDTYKGVKVSRKQLYGKEEEDDDEEIDSTLADLVEIQDDDEEGIDEE